MFPINKLLLVGVITTALTAPVLNASTIVQKSFEQVSESAELVFEGRVSGLWTESEGKKIYTWVEFEILDVVKGSYGTDQISLRYLGGSSGERSMKVDRMRQPEIGEQGIYFVNDITKKYVHPLVGWGQGHFLLKPVKAGGPLKVHDSRGRPVSGITSTTNKIRMFNATKASGVELVKGEQEAMSLDVFKQQIREAAQ